MELSIIDVIEETTVDGPGFRTSIYCAGCQHQCPGCHNPQSWSRDAGHMVPVETLLQQVLDDPFSDVTFSGGDPMYQPEGFTELARQIKEKSDKTIWCYSGFTYESILMNPKTNEMLRYIDVLVDGPYVESLRDTDLQFRGSSNQRLIDVQASLLHHCTVLWQSPMC